MPYFALLPSPSALLYLVFAEQVFFLFTHSQWRIQQSTHVGPHKDGLSNSPGYFKDKDHRWTGCEDIYHTIKTHSNENGVSDKLLCHCSDNEGHI